MKIVSIIGARPQFIKAATLSRAFINQDIEEIIVHTGQHYDPNMSKIFFEELQIPKPKYNFNVKSPFHGEMTAQILEHSERVIQQESPDLVLVYGDTNSTLAGSLAAAKLNTPVAHVEAGLRSFNRRMPEEVNRVITDHISELLFCPTTTSVKNLLNEGISKKKIYQVGDIMFDSMVYYRKQVKQKSTIIERLNFHKPFALATIHRAENTDDPKRLNAILNQLKKISREKIVVLPLHPRTKNKLEQSFQSTTLRIIPPVGYFEMIDLLQHCALVITDSGGVQKEAYWNRKYCITMRGETEWTELIEAGVNRLASPISSLPKLVKEFWDKKIQLKKLDLYGDGSTAQKIVKVLKKQFR